jgi:hypothetical protein
MIFSIEFDVDSSVSSLLVHYHGTAAAKWSDLGWDRIVRNGTNTGCKAKNCHLSCIKNINVAAC